jgi:hypothetical protein
MKPALTATATVLGCVLAAGSAWAQNPSVIQNTRSTMNAVSNNATAASNQALETQPSVAHPATPAAVGAIHAVPKSSGAVVTPVNSSSPASPSAGSKAGVKTRRVKKGIAAVAVQHSVQPKPEVVSQSNPPVGTLAGHGAREVGNETEQSVEPESKYNANGRRDPFISPVVSHAGGSNCSTGKKCLEIGTISLRGVVHAETGFIAVVSNGLNKAYFLRENDPVFNGYVMRITGDSIVFQETLQDRLGKTFTREVVKKITAPAV